jgi:hypothetical protein
LVDCKEIDIEQQTTVQKDHKDPTEDLETVRHTIESSTSGPQNTVYSKQRRQVKRERDRESERDTHSQTGMREREREK